MNRLKVYALAIVIAGAGCGAFYFAIQKIPSISHGLISAGFARKITNLTPVADLIDRRENLDEVKAFLDKQIAAGATHDAFFVNRARVEEIQQGPDEAFLLLLSHLPKLRGTEQTGQWIELAKLAGLTERWESMFSALMLLADYGDMQSVTQIMSAMRSRPGFAEALYSPWGLRFIEYARLDRNQAVPFSKDQQKQAAYFSMWKTLDGNDEASELPAAPLNDDPRFAAVDALEKKAEWNLDGPALLSPSNFIYREKKLTSGDWLSRGAYDATLSQPASGPLWLVVKASPVLHVYPMAIQRLDDEISLQYLPYDSDFPHPLQRRDGKPFSRIQFDFVNDFISEWTKQDRNIYIKGIWPEDAITRVQQPATSAVR